MLHGLCKVLLQEWSEDILQLLPWILEHSLSGHSFHRCSLLGSRCHTVRSPRHLENAHVDALVNSLAQPLANSQHELRNDSDLPGHFSQLYL